MTKPIEVSHRNWHRLVAQLKQDYPTSVLLIREKTKAKLGFVPREYRDWDNDNLQYRKNCIMLDFYSEKKRTFFLMKYSEYLDEQK